MANKKPRVVADGREVGSGVPEKIAKLGVNVKTRVLGIGDYMLVGDILIERKTADDFVASVFDGRLFEQASRISGVCGRPVLVVENPLHGALQWVSNRDAIYGALAMVAFGYGFAVFQTRDSDEMAQLIATVAKHGRYGNPRHASLIVRGRPRGSSWQRQLP